jgi:hypothetical protein
MSASILGLLQATDRTGTVMSRLDVKHWPVTVGRALSADLLIDDRHVAGEHARIDRTPEGEVTVEVLDTANGVVLGGVRHGRGAQFIWPSSQALTLGRLKLGLRLAEEPVPAEEPLPRLLSHKIAWTVVALAGMLAMVVAQAWITTVEPPQLVRQLPGLLAGLVAGIAVWAGLWALATKLFSGRLQFWRHVRIACVSSVAVKAGSVLAGLLAFMFSLESLSRYDDQLQLLGFAVAVFFHLAVIAPHRRRGMAMIVSGVAALSMVTLLGSNWLQSKRLSDKLYMSVLYPPSLRVAPTVSVGQFLDEAGAIRARLDTRLKDREEADSDALKDADED